MRTEKPWSGVGVLAKAAGLSLVAGLAFVAIPAEAHFKLEAPADAIITDLQGDPQKAGPCTAGTASNIRTKVAAGSKLHIKINETIVHGGHYRISLAPNRASFVGAVPVVTGGQC